MVNTRLSGYDGDEFASLLRKSGIEPEFCDRDYAVLMLTEFNSQGELEALENFFWSLETKEPIERELVKAPKCQRAMSVREAVFAPSELVPTELSLGRVCAAPTVSCPPAVPIAVSGEVINRECLEAFSYYGITEVRAVKK